MERKASDSSTKNKFQDKNKMSDETNLIQFRHFLLDTIIIKRYFFLNDQQSRNAYNYHVQQVIDHIKALINIIADVKQRIKSKTISELLFYAIESGFELAKLLLSRILFRTPEVRIDRSLSLIELSELLFYEEIEDETANDNNNQVFMPYRTMHNYIPLNPFKATVRIHHIPRDHSRGMIGSETGGGTDTQDSLSYLDGVSPASYPSTPFSRSYLMNKFSERVDSVMFSARDRLRLEAQSVSHDRYSRMAAMEAQNSGQFAVFDPKQTSSGIALSCGNHCAVKVGKGLCCCSRSMMPIRVNNYVYMEFSVTVSNDQIPTLGIGLTPPDCPLNVMVGSWQRSVGIYSDGQLLVGSHWYSSLSGAKLHAGSTIGMLVYIPSNDKQYESEASNDDNIIMQENKSENGNIFNSNDSNGSILSKSVILRINIDGVLVKYGANVAESINDLCSFNAVQYPTVSIFSENTRVWCRLCAADIVYRSRESIGAPNNSRIYCLDGSLLLDEND
eukprot:gene6191-8527_t